MPFHLNDLIRIYPLVYHLTARANLPRISTTGRLESAAVLMRSAGRLDLLRARRKGPAPIEVDGSIITLRDQDPLHAGHILFEGGWVFAQVIESLNRRVFFWPGREAGPIAHGQRHFQRYAGERPAILRVRLRDLVAANPGWPPLLCAYNSGSPRTTAGRKSPRGPRTFLPCEEFPRARGKVVEVTFEEAVALPKEASEVRVDADAGWRPLAALETED
jgi:hypothetical protein